MRPIPETGPGLSSVTGQATRRLCLALHRMGFIVPRKLPSGRWAFTPPFHPYHNVRTSTSWRSVFCDTFHRRKLACPPSAAFPRHAALWCSDFPLPPKRKRPSTQGEIYPISPHHPSLKSSIRGSRRRLCAGPSWNPRRLPCGLTLLHFSVNYSPCSNTLLSSS